MNGIRAKRLLSGASAIAILAAFGSLGPALAAPTTVNGPGNSPAIVVPPNTDYINILGGANILTNGSGNSIDNSGTIGIGTHSAIVIDHSTLQGTIFNSGTVTSGFLVGAAGIHANASQLLGGINNTGNIGGDDRGIEILGNSNLFDGITNSGDIAGHMGDALHFDGDTFSGGIDNQLGGVFSGGENGISLAATSFSGGIKNAGDIIAAAGTGILSNVGLFSGGINNSGHISASGNGIDLSGDTFTDGIVNTGSIAGDGVGIHVNLDASFSGGIDNRGLIAFEGAGILLDNSDAVFTGGILNSGTLVSDGSDAIQINVGTFQGGINNSGTVSAALYGIHVSSDVTSFQGGITNGGLLSASSNAIYIAGSFAGGIHNTGTILSAQTAIYISNTVFNGGISNTGTIDGTTAIGISNTVFNGGITNSGLIDGQSELAITISNTVFTGGIVNSGTLLGDTAGIKIDNTTFGGGIDNSGTILTNGTGIAISNTAFSGGIKNSGSIIGGTKTAVLIDVTSFQGDFLNTGLIRTGTGGPAVSLSATAFDGAFNNNAGTIDGGTNTAINIDVSNWTGGFSNSGHILSATSKGVGIAASTWSADFNSSGVIDAFATGVNIDIGTSWIGSFINSGTIVSRNSQAVTISGSTWTGNFTNSGSIRALTDAAIHIDANDFTGNFSNSGLIEAVDQGVLFDLVSFRGDFSNSGSITSATTEAVRFNIATFHGNIMNTGLIRGLHDALKIDGGTTVEGDIINGGTIRSLGEDGLDVNGIVEGKLTNTGVLQGLRDGLDLDGEIRGGIFTSGSIIGQNGNAIDFGNAATANVVTQTGGLIDGDFNMVNGFADTYFADDGTYQGDILADAGDIISVGPHSPMAFAAGSLDGADLIDFVSGVGVLGSAAVGVDGPGFDITDTDAMRVRQNAAAYLDNNTTVDLNNDLTLDPGVPGKPGGTLMYYLTPNETVHGQINATNANIDDGNLVVVPSSGIFTEGVTYTYLEVITGSIGGGTFDSVTASSIFFDVDAIYHANSVDLELVRMSFAGGLAATGGSQNEVATGQALDDIFDAGGFGTDFNNLRNYLLAFGDDAEARRVLDDIDGNEHAQFQRALIAVADNFNQGVAGRLDVAKVSLGGTQWSAIEARYASAVAGVATDGASSTLPSSHGLATRGRSGISIWGSATGATSNVDGDGNASGYDQNSAGAIGGIDYSSSPDSVFGLSGGWQTGSVDFDTPRDSGDLDSWHAGAYGSFGLGDFYLDTTAAAGFYDVKSTRFINNGVFTGTANADYNAWSGGATGEIGTVLSGGGFAFQPSIGVAYTHINVDAFTETGAGAFNLIVDDADADSIASTVGLRATTQWTSGRTRFLPELSVGWRHEFMDSTHGFSGAFQEDPATLFNIVSSDISRDSVLFGLGVTAAVTERVELFVDYKGAYSGDANSHDGSLGARFSW